MDSFAFLGSRPGTDSFDLFVLCWATSATAVPVARHGPVLLRTPAPRAGPCFCRDRWDGYPDRVQELSASVICASKHRLTVRRLLSVFAGKRTFSACDGTSQMCPIRSVFGRPRDVGDDAGRPGAYSQRICKTAIRYSRALRKIAAFLNLCESDCHNRIRGCGYDGSIRFF